MLDKWVSDNPTFIRKMKIGESYEKRDLNVYILTNTTTYQSNSNTRPKFLLTSLTHSREPGGLVITLYFIGQFLICAKQFTPECADIL